MKKPFILFVIIGIIYILSPSLYADPGDLYLRYIEGDVFLKTKDSSDWEQVAINTPIYDGDTLWVSEEGRAELFFIDSSVVRLDKNSILQILSPQKNEYHLYLSTGQVYANFRGKGIKIFTIDTPYASLHIPPQSTPVFSIEVTGQGDTQLFVMKGEVYAARPQGQIHIGAGEGFTFRNNASLEIARLNQTDTWMHWNLDRDKELYGARYYDGITYLPDELNAFSSDFDKNGKWYTTQEYGYVWVPTIVSVVNWSPYRIGRWRWICGSYVWISHEPWGWVPYHYGRWAHITPYGWCWVPPTRGLAIWSPGYVAWSYTNTHISWVPLAPREVYHGHTIKTKNMYRNTYIKNAVVTGTHDRFFRGHPMVGTALHANPFLTKRVAMAPPENKPEKTITHPAATHPAAINTRNRVPINTTQKIQTPMVAVPRENKPYLVHSKIVPDKNSQRIVSFKKSINQQNIYPQSVTWPVNYRTAQPQPLTTSSHIRPPPAPSTMRNTPNRNSFLPRGRQR